MHDVICKHSTIQCAECTWKCYKICKWPGVRVEAPSGVDLERADELSFTGHRQGSILMMNS